MKIEPKHDFTAKLRQEHVLPGVLQYVAWQRAARAAKAKGEEVPEMPLNLGLASINLDLTTACNYACDHCIDFEILNGSMRHEHDKLMESLEDMIKKGLRSVILIGGGEPTLYPGFSEAVSLFKKHGVQVAIVTNGSRNKKIMEVAGMLSKRDWVRLSLDSGTDETFQKMHKPKKAVRLEEICSWVPRIRKLNPELPVGFSFIIVWAGAEREKGANIVENIGEIVSAAKLAREHGFSYISFKPFLTRRPNGAEVMDPSVMTNFHETVGRIVDAVAEAKSLETEGFKVVESTNLRVLVEGTWQDFTRQPRNCHMTAFRQVISPLGAFNCPTHRGIPEARVGDNPAAIGRTLSGKPLIVLRNRVGESSRQQTARSIDQFDAAEACREITCLYNSANWWLEDLINSGSDLSQVTALADRGDYYL
ncbi:MAG: radical SAM protein [bacterium]|nr:radical SAM protein [bacterium]